MKKEVKIILNHNDESLAPIRKDGDVGFDLKSIEDKSINPGSVELINCGFKMEMPDNFEAQIRPRSGLALKYHVTVLNTPGTVDPSYRGDICVILINQGSETFNIKRGDRIAQMIFNKVELPELKIVSQLTETERGEGGFGSTGI